MADLNDILFMGHFSEAPVKGAMFYNGTIHREHDLWPLLNKAKVVIEIEHITLSRRCYYRKYLRFFQGHKFLVLWDYVTRKNYLKNYAIGYDRIFSVHAQAGDEIYDRWGKPAKFWPHGYNPKVSYPVEDCLIRYDIGFCGFLGERPGWESNPIYSKRREVVSALQEHFGDKMCVRGGIYGKEYNRFWNECKIGINCSPLGEATLRVYEVLATGTALVTDRSKDLELIFNDGEHLLMYDSPDEAISCCERLLADPEMRKFIAENGRRAVAKYERSGQYRYLAEEAINFLEEHPLGDIPKITPFSEPLHEEPVFA